MWVRAKGPGRWLRLRVRAIDRVVTAGEFLPVTLRHPAVVYAMGKTGTTSLTAAIELETGRDVLKVHSLNRTRLQDEARAATARHERPRFQWRSDALRRVIATLPSRQWDIVTVVRDPVARALSAYFYRRRLGLDDGQQATSDSERLASQVEDFVRTIAFERDWYVEELRHTTGIDVYTEPFDTSIGYSIIERGRFRVLLLRNEDLRSTAPHALAEFFGIPHSVALPELNTGRSRDADYDDFRASWCPPRSLIDAVYETRLMRHFYGPEHLNSFKEHWLRGG